MKKLFLSSLCLLCMMAATGFTSASAVDDDPEVQFTITWDVSGAPVDVLMDGRVLLSNLLGTGSVTLDINPGGHNLTIVPQEGYKIGSQSIEQGQNSMSISVQLIPLSEKD